MSNDESNPNQGPDVKSPATDSTANPAAPTVSDDLKKIIQSETDKLRTHYSQELKKQQQVIDDLKKSSMTEAELRKYKESQLQERESLLHRKELELLSVDVLKDLNLSPSLRELIIGKDADETKVRAETLRTEFQKAVETTVQERFKQNGREPHKSESTPPAGKGKIYTRAEVDALSKNVVDPKIPLAERTALQAELRAAMSEGRIKQ
jgi:hypothetical protein